MSEEEKKMLPYYLVIIEDCAIIHVEHFLYPGKGLNNKDITISDVKECPDIEELVINLGLTPYMDSGFRMITYLITDTIKITKRINPENEIGYSHPGALQIYEQ